MRIRAIEDILGALTLIPLRPLAATTHEPYLALLLQPNGHVVATPARIGHVDSGAVAPVGKAFLSLGAERHADLVVVPEYYLPWAVVDDILGGKLSPDEGALWVLGCESIAPADLLQVAARARARSIFFYHEQLDEVEAAHKAFIDPLLYVFWCKTSTGGSVLCMVVQFKTTPCRDDLDLEQQHLYLGSTVYVFNRGLNRIGLLTIICSDAFDFKPALIDEFYANCLVIHIQLNPKPAHDVYASYRRHLHSVGSHDHVELLCLNWAGGFDVQDAAAQGARWDYFASSAWYSPPVHYSASDALINDAHAAGLYYSLVDQRWHTFYFNGQPHALLLRKQKVIFPGNQVLQPSSCITVAGRWTWEQTSGSWNAQARADDGFSTVASSYPVLSSQLPPAVVADPLAVERALELLVVPSGPASTWYQVRELLAVRVASEESIRRVTVHQEADPARLGVPFRRSRLQRAEDALLLPTVDVPWPPPVRDLSAGYFFTWSPDAPHCNVIATSSGGLATLVYLADEADAAAVTSAHQKVHNWLLHDAIDRAATSPYIRDIVARAADRLCVVFRRNHAFHVWTDSTAPRIDSPPKTSAVDIAGDSHD